MASLHDPKENLIELSILLILSGIGWLLAVYFVCRPGLPPVPASVWICFILIGLGARAAAWQIPLVLTDDPFRYRSEGRLQSDGGNPYLTRPIDSPAKTGDERIPGPGFRAIYGPLLLLIERATYSVAGENISLWRLPAIAADLLTALFLALWHRSPRWLIYWLCPLPIIEFWSSGHHDAILLALLSLGLWLGKRGGIIAWSLAVYTKYWPILLIPYFDTRRGLVAVLAGAALFIPYLGDLAKLEQNARYLSGFVGGWRNNDSLYGLLLALTGDAHHAKYLAFALIAVAWILIARLTWPLERKCLALIIALLLLSANVHPWYLTWMLPFLTRQPFLPAMVWIVLAPLFYAPLFDWWWLHHWDGVRDSRWLVYGGVAASAAAGGLIRTMGSKVPSMKEK